MKGIIETIENNKLFIKIDKEIYDKVTVLKTSYIFQDQCFLHIESLSNSAYGVIITRKSRDVDLKLIAQQFCNELIDQQLRLENEQMYGDIRKAIIKQAFNPVEFDKLKKYYDK